MGLQKGYKDTIHTDMRGMGGRWGGQAECVRNDGMGVWREYDVRNVRPTGKKAINNNQCKKHNCFDRG